MSRYADHELITWEQARNAAPRIRELRGTRTRGQLSITSGVGVSAIAHAETARTRLTTENAGRLARALGTDLEGLTGDDPVMAGNGERAS